MKKIKMKKVIKTLKKMGKYNDVQKLSKKKIIKSFKKEIIAAQAVNMELTDKINLFDKKHQKEPIFIEVKKKLRKLDKLITNAYDTEFDGLNKMEIVYRQIKALARIEQFKLDITDTLKKFRDRIGEPDVNFDMETMALNSIDEIRKVLMDLVGSISEKSLTKFKSLKKTQAYKELERLIEEFKVEFIKVTEADIKRLSSQGERYMEINANDFSTLTRGKDKLRLLVSKLTRQEEILSQNLLKADAAAKLRAASEKFKKK